MHATPNRIRPTVGFGSPSKKAYRARHVVVHFAVGAVDGFLFQGELPRRHGLAEKPLAHLSRASDSDDSVAAFQWQRSERRVVSSAFPEQDFNLLHGIGHADLFVTKLEICRDVAELKNDRMRLTYRVWCCH